MKRFSKLFCGFVVAAVMMLTMTSCSGYSFYDDWSGAGADIEKENIFITVSLEEVGKKIEADDTFALVYATSSSTACVSVITSLQAQAEYLGCEDKKIYFLDATNYLSTSTLRSEVRSVTRMHEAMSSPSANPVILTYKKGALDVDTSNLNKTQTKKFLSGSSVQYASLSSYIFRELLAE